MTALQSIFGEDASILRETNYQLLVVTTTLPTLGTTLLSPVLDSLIDPFGTTPANIGLMISVFTAPAIVMIPVGGILADRFGRKAVMLSSVALFGISGTAIPLTTDYSVVLVLRALQGVGFAGINPIIIASIGDMYDFGRETTGQGIRQMAAGLSGAVFPVGAGFLILIDWYVPFLLYALAAPIAVGLYRWFEEPTIGRGDDRSDRDLAVYASALFRLIRRPHVFSLVLARSLMNVVWVGFLTYNSLFVVHLMNGSPLQAGVLASTGLLLFAISAGQAGRVVSLFANRLSLLLIANIALGVGFSTVVFAPGIVHATAGIALAGVGYGLLASLYRDVITGLAPTELRAGLVGLAESGGRLTSTLSPLAMGAVIAVASPTMGFPTALRLAGVGVAVVGAGGGIACLVLAGTTRPEATGAS